MAAKRISGSFLNSMRKAKGKSKNHNNNDGKDENKIQSDSQQWTTYVKKSNEFTQPQMYPPLVQKPLFEQSIPYYSTMTKEVAEKILSNSRDGSYLLRPSNERAHSKVLSFRAADGSIKHHNIHQEEKHFVLQLEQPDAHHFMNIQSAALHVLEQEVTDNKGFMPSPYLILSDQEKPAEQKSPMRNDQSPDPRKARPPKRQSTDIPPAINEGPPGFYGMLTREKAEYMLSNKPHGTYIVRECETRKGEFTVSVKKDKEVSHVIISNASQDNLQGPLDVQLTRITNELGCTPVAYGDDRHIYDVSPGLNEIDTISWFYEKLTADEGTKILQHHPMGTYLLRECRSSKGNFTLMWRDLTEVRRIIILTLNDPVKLYKVMNEEPVRTFTTITTTVNHFMEMKARKLGKDFIPTPYTGQSADDIYTDFNREENESIPDTTTTISDTSSQVSTSNDEGTLRPKKPPSTKKKNQSPFNYFKQFPELKDIPYYHPKLTRSGSKSKLRDSADGSYLLRDCFTSKGNFVLSYKYDGEVIDLVILVIAKNTYKLYNQKPERLFKTLSKAVQHFIEKKSESDFPKFRGNPVRYIESTPLSSAESLQFINYADPNDELQKTSSVMGSERNDSSYITMRSPELKGSYTSSV